MWLKTGPTSTSSTGVSNSYERSNSTLHASGASALNDHFPFSALKGPSCSARVIDSGALLTFFGREMRRHSLEADVDARDFPLRRPGDHLGAAAPWQELAIALDVVDEVEHLLRAVRDEDGAVDGLHVARMPR